MSTIIGLVVVIGAVLGGFAMSGGPFPVLLQPNELVVIGGAAFGTLVISAPGKIMKRVSAAFKKGFQNHIPTAKDYEALLQLLYGVFQLTRREGMLALESHLENPAESPLFKKYPAVTHRHHAMTFLCDGLRQLVDGCSVSELSLLFDAELETLHEEEHQPIALLKTTGDALPGLGIVAAVLGIVITMGAIDGPVEEIGEKVGAALVGTFLGILLSYGLFAPLATKMEFIGAAELAYYRTIASLVESFANQVPPKVALELARRGLSSDVRPEQEELEALLKAAEAS